MREVDPDPARVASRPTRKESTPWCPRCRHRSRVHRGAGKYRKTCDPCRDEIHRQIKRGAFWCSFCGRPMSSLQTVTFIENMVLCGPCGKP